MEYHKQGHCVYYSQYHLVLATKYRRRIFNSGISAYFQTIVHRITDYVPDIRILACNSDNDHVHLQISIPPKYPVSKVVCLIKSNTAEALREHFDFLDLVYWKRGGIWSDGYFVSTIGINEDIIRRYIEQQGKEDSGQAKLVL